MSPSLEITAAPLDELERRVSSVDELEAEAAALNRAASAPVVYLDDRRDITELCSAATWAMTLCRRVDDAKLLLRGARR